MISWIPTAQTPGPRVCDGTGGAIVSDRVLRSQRQLMRETTQAILNDDEAIVRLDEAVMVCNSALAAAKLVEDRNQSRCWEIKNLTGLTALRMKPVGGNPGRTAAPGSMELQVQSAHDDGDWSAGRKGP